jgi:hypothetical protein
LVSFLQPILMFASKAGAYSQASDYAGNTYQGQTLQLI